MNTFRTLIAAKRVRNGVFSVNVMRLQTCDNRPLENSFETEDMNLVNDIFEYMEMKANGDFSSENLIKHNNWNEVYDTILKMANIIN